MNVVFERDLTSFLVVTNNVYCTPPRRLDVVCILLIIQQEVYLFAILNITDSQRKRIEKKKTGPRQHNHDTVPAVPNSMQKLTGRPTKWPERSPQDQWNLHRIEPCTFQNQRSMTTAPPPLSPAAPPSVCTTVARQIMTTVQDVQSYSKCFRLI